MRRTLIILGILTGLAVLLVIVILVTRGTIGDQTSSACQDILISLREGDTDESFNLLSPEYQGIVTREAWQDNVDLYKVLLEGGTQTPWFIRSETPETSEDDEFSSTTERYRVDSSGGEWDGLCTFYRGNTLIDGFTLVEAGRTP